MHLQPVEHSHLSLSIRTTIECVIDSFYGLAISFKECSAPINRILLLFLLLLLPFLLRSVYVCRLPFSFHFRVETVLNGSPRLCHGRVAFRDYILQGNSEYLHVQSRGGARTSKPLFHRYLLERKERNVSSLVHIA